MGCVVTTQTVYAVFKCQVTEQETSLEPGAEKQNVNPQCREWAQKLELSSRTGLSGV